MKRNKKNVVFVHAMGNQNSRYALYGLKKKDLLHSFHTSIACFKNSVLFKLSQIPFFKDFRRREFDNIVKKETHTYPLYEGLRRFNMLFKNNSKITPDDVFHYIDKKVASYITHHSKEISAIYSTDEGAFYSFTKAKELGIKCLFDLPIIHWRTYQKLLEEEKVKNPEWSSILGIYNDSKEKLDRKDQELLLADKIYVASNFTKQSILNDYPYKLNAEIEVIPYGFPKVNMNRQYIPIENRKLKFLYVGRLSQSKGLSYLFESVSQFKNEIDLTLVGYGDIENCKVLKEQIQNYKYIPYLTHDKVLSLMAESDVLIFPSLFEGFGMVITEAMSQGTPVITTTRTCGRDFIVDGINGWLVEPGNSKLLKSKIKNILDNKCKLLEISKNAMQTASKRPWSVYEEELAESINKFLND